MKEEAWSPLSNFIRLINNYYCSDSAEQVEVKKKRKKEKKNEREETMMHYKLPTGAYKRYKQLLKKIGRWDIL